MRGSEITEEGALNICVAVLKRTIKDYKLVCRRIDMARSRGAEPSKRDLDEADKIERFFRSEKFHLFAGSIDMTDLAKRVPELRRMVDNGDL